MIKGEQPFVAPIGHRPNTHSCPSKDYDCPSKNNYPGKVARTITSTLHKYTYRLTPLTNLSVVALHVHHPHSLEEEGRRRLGRRQQLKELSSSTIILRHPPKDLRSNTINCDFTWDLINLRTNISIPFQRDLIVNTRLCSVNVRSNPLPHNDMRNVTTAFSFSSNQENTDNATVLQPHRSFSIAVGTSSLPLQDFRSVIKLLPRYRPVITNPKAIGQSRQRISWSHEYSN